MSRSRTFRSVMLVFFGLGLGTIAAIGSGSLTPLLISRPVGPNTLDDLAPIEVGEVDRAAPVELMEGWPRLFGPQSDSIVPANRAETLGWNGSTPEVVWRKSIGAGYSSPVIAEQKAVVLHRTGDEELTSVFDLVTGDVIWERRDPTSYVCPNPPHSSGPYSTPLILNGRVYVQSAEGMLRCLDFANGETIWERNLSEEYKVPENVFAVGHTLAVYKDMLILNIGGEPEAGVIAVDQQSGETRWTSTTHTASYATPQLATIHGKSFCFVLAADSAMSLNPDTGAEDWSFPFKAIAEDFVNATSPVVYGDVVIFTAYQAGTKYLRILPDRGYEEIRQDKRTLVSQFNPLTCRDGYLYGWHFFDKSFRCVDLASGELLWKYNGRLGRGTHVISGDSILLYGESGKISVISTNPHELTELKEPTEPLLAEPAFSAPAISNGYVLLKNEEEVVCIRAVP